MRFWQGHGGRANLTVRFETEDEDFYSEFNDDLDDDDMDMFGDDSFEDYGFEENWN